MSWLTTGDVSCVHCLGVRTAFVRIDRRSRPYLVCMACGSRSFVGVTAALSGCAILAPLVEDFARRAAEDPAFAAELDARREAFLAELRARMAPQPPAAAPSGAGISAADRRVA